MKNFGTNDLTKKMLVCLNQIVYLRSLIKNTHKTMKKIMILALAVVFSTSCAFAQKVKIVSGDVSFLKETESFNVEFVYPDDMKVGKGSQKEYIEKKKAKAEEKEAGAGERWEEAWYADREEHFEPRFLELLGKYLGSKDIDVISDPSNKITMFVTTTFIEPGYNVGISRRPALIDLKITFKDTDSDKELAELSVKKSPGNAPIGMDFDAGVRMGEAYAKAGKTLAKVLIKKAKL